MSHKRLREIATQESIDYALVRADHFERKNPMVALVYRVVADVLTHEKELVEAEVAAKDAA